MSVPDLEKTFLHHFAGDWSFENSSTRPSDGCACTCDGQSNMRAFGNSIVGELHGTFSDGSQMLGHLALAYDILKKKLVSSYLCADAGFLWAYEGELDINGKLAVLEADGPDFCSQGKPGGSARYRGVFEINGHDRWSYTGLIRTHDGEWKQIVKADYRRRGAR